MKKFFKDWNYRKHAKVVTCIYAAMYIIDMTAGYYIAKKCLGQTEEKEKSE